MRQMMVNEMSRILEEIRGWPQEERLRDPGAYKLGYTALRQLFAIKLDFGNLDDIRAGGYAVYGWMPTILSRWPADETLLALGKLAILARTKTRAEVRKAINEKLPLARSPLHAFKNSIVGPSKFLHFAAPEVFPIWDSVVASNFGLRHQYQISDQDKYLAYFDAIHTCVEQDLGTRALLQTLALPNVSKVRSLEYLLYLYGQKNIAAGKQKAAADPS